MRKTGNLGENIRENRERIGYRQRELAALLNVSDTAVCKWETGKAIPTTTNLINMARLFGVSLDALTQ